jgi:hypothetical protein
MAHQETISSKLLSQARSQKYSCTTLPLCQQPIYFEPLQATRYILRKHAIKLCTTVGTRGRFLIHNRSAETFKLNDCAMS